MRSIGGSVSKTWNSINPATLSGAIDVIVVEQEDGTDRSYNHALLPSLTLFVRITGMLTIPYPLWKILLTEAVRKESVLLSHLAPGARLTRRSL